VVHARLRRSHEKTLEPDIGELSTLTTAIKIAIESVCKRLTAVNDGSIVGPKTWESHYPDNSLGFPALRKLLYLDLNSFLESYLAQWLSFFFILPSLIGPERSINSKNSTDL
jgi:hypothetical protein